MTGPLTYPPEIVIDSIIDLPPEFGQEGSIKGRFELALMMIEIVIELLGGL